MALSTGAGNALHHLGHALRSDRDERGDLARTRAAAARCRIAPYPANGRTVGAARCVHGSTDRRVERSYAQPLTLRLDPRVTTPAAGLAQLSSLSRQMYDNAVAARAAYARARALRERLDSGRGANATALAAKLDAIAPAKPDSNADAPRGQEAAKPEASPTLESVSNQLMAAAMAMQGADIAPTANQIAACRRASATYRTVMAQWSALENRGAPWRRRTSGRLPGDGRLTTG